MVGQHCIPLRTWKILAHGWKTQLNKNANEHIGMKDSNLNVTHHHHSLCFLWHFLGFPGFSTGFPCVFPFSPSNFLWAKALTVSLHLALQSLQPALRQNARCPAEEDGEQSLGSKLPWLQGMRSSFEGYWFLYQKKGLPMLEKCDSPSGKTYGFIFCLCLKMGMESSWSWWFNRICFRGPGQK